MYNGLQYGINIPPIDGNPSYGGGLSFNPPAMATDTIPRKKVLPLAIAPDYGSYVNKIFSDYPALNSFAKPQDFLVRDASGKMKDILSKNKFSLEYQGKGQDKYIVGKDTLNLDNVDKHRIYIDPDQVKPENRYDAIKLDILSHSMHNNPKYGEFTKDLEKQLITKYGKKMVDENGGVNAYVRGHLSTTPDYQPYKDEMKFLPKGYMDKLDLILKGK